MLQENIGPAERIVNSLLSFNDHLVHNRPGVIVPSTDAIGVTWTQACWKQEGEHKVVYRKDKIGKKTKLTKLGNLQADNTIEGSNAKYKPPGLFVEVARYMYRLIADVWNLDNEFAAKWASYVYKNDKSKDRKVIMAAFMLVQSRKGDPVLDNGKVAFYDEDYRDIGEAMVLLDGSNYLDAKLILRIREVLSLPQIADINRQLGFGQSTRNPFLGRFPKVARAWLKYREENLKLLEGLVKSGFSNKIQDLARSVQYKPESPAFFETLRWKQSQSKNGHRALAIGTAVKAADTWEGLTERQICERIVATKPNFKRIVGMLPVSVGLTRAVMGAAIEVGSLSSKDFVIQVPTLEKLELLSVAEIKAKVDAAINAAEDQRAANIALRVKSKELQASLQEGAENVSKKEVAEQLKGLFIQVIVDISGSMESAIEVAKQCLIKLLPAFPLDKISVSVFNSAGRLVEIKHASGAGVENAFRGIKAGGATTHASGVLAHQGVSIPADHDVLTIFIGDEEESGRFDDTVRRMPYKTVAFGLIKVRQSAYSIVRDTAAALQIPCLILDPKVFEDTYALPQTLRHMIASTPVGKAGSNPAPFQRETLVDTILKTELLKKPIWAEAA